MNMYNNNNNEQTFKNYKKFTVKSYLNGNDSDIKLLTRIKSFND